MIYFVPQCPASQPTPALVQVGECPLWLLSTLGSSCTGRPKVKESPSLTITRLNNKYYKYRTETEEMLLHAECCM